ncbi:MAG: DUF4194 domain-containing protein [Treponemataceae bacterium]
MIDELEPLGDLAEFEEAEFDLFTRTVRELLARTFLVRGVDERLYDFAVRNFGLLEPFFSCMGAQLRKDEGLGVVAWRGGAETRARLGREETCALLALRLLYEEKRNAVSLTDFPTVTVFDFVERFKALTEGDLKKTRLIEMLRRFTAAKLIRSPREEADPDAQLILYPSLALCLDQDGIEEILGFIKTESANGVAANAAAASTGSVSDEADAEGGDR